MGFLIAVLMVYAGSMLIQSSMTGEVNNPFTYLCGVILIGMAIKAREKIEGNDK